MPSSSFCQHPSNKFSLWSRKNIALEILTEAVRRGKSIPNVDEDKRNKDTRYALCADGTMTDYLQTHSFQCKLESLVRELLKKYRKNKF